MGRLSKLPNIGAALEKQLIEAGITTEEELKSVGSREAWLRILARDPSACLNRLCALEGAVQGVRWHNLDERRKSRSRRFTTNTRDKAALRRLRRASGLPWKSARAGETRRAAGKALTPRGQNDAVHDSDNKTPAVC